MEICTAVKTKRKSCFTSCIRASFRQAGNESWHDLNPQLYNDS